MSKEDLGPRTPLMPEKVKYRLRSNDNAALVLVYVGPKKVGGLHAYWETPSRATCKDDIAKIREKYPQVGENLLIAEESEILPEYQGKHIGRAMYDAMMVEMFKKRGPFLFAPMHCTGAGTTSVSARRVWQSLARDYPSIGSVVAVVQRPTLPAEKVAIQVVRRYLATLG